MEDALRRAVERAIQHMHENLCEPLTIDDLADVAMFSKFHFSRVFRNITGIPPGRFLSAVRLQEAKRLLLSTSLTVADISSQVGYSSIGTFSTRFKSSVGVSPTMYRAGEGFVPMITVDGRRDDWGRCSADLTGCVLPPEEGETGTVFVGLFPEPLPQGAPVRCDALDRPGPYVLPAVPQGTWYVLAYTTPKDAPYPLLSDDPIRVGRRGPVTISAHTSAVPHTDVPLRPLDVIDPPVLLAMFDTRAGALAC